MSRLLGAGDEVGRDVATSSGVSAAFAPSNGITPSGPIRSVSSATSSPVVGELCAEVVTTGAFSRPLSASR